MAKQNAGSPTGAEGRRRYWRQDAKRRIVAESFEEGASVAEVARRYGLNANLVFTWRRQFGEPAAEAPAILPVTIAPPPALPTAPAATSRIEITLSCGDRIVVGADVEARALARVIEALRR
jgi:transposase